MSHTARETAHTALAATAWAEVGYVEREQPIGVAVWEDDSEAVAILSTMLANPPAEERLRVPYVITRDELIRYRGRRAARLEAIKDRFDQAAIARCDHAAFCAQRPVATVIHAILRGLELAPVRRVSAKGVAA